VERSEPLTIGLWLRRSGDHAMALIAALVHDLHLTEAEGVRLNKAHNLTCPSHAFKAPLTYEC